MKIEPKDRSVAIPFETWQLLDSYRQRTGASHKAVAKMAIAAWMKLNGSKKRKGGR